MRNKEFISHSNPENNDQARWLGLQLMTLGFEVWSDFYNLRGLAYINGPSSGYLWSVGFVPRLGTSLASEVPNPLYSEIIQGKSDIKQVLQDILALTKLNYNVCIYADGKPVTLRFADNIGDILTAAPLNNSEVPPLSFKYCI